MDPRIQLIDMYWDMYWACLNWSTCIKRSLRFQELPSSWTVLGISLRHPIDFKICSRLNFLHGLSSYKHWPNNIHFYAQLNWVQWMMVVLFKYLHLRSWNNINNLTVVTYRKFQPKPSKMSLNCLNHFNTDLKSSTSMFFSTEF